MNRNQLFRVMLGMLAFAVVLVVCESRADACLRKLFNRGGDCCGQTCCDTACEPACDCPAEPACECPAEPSCECESSCCCDDPCGRRSRGGRLRGLFGGRNRGGDCCCASNCGCAE